MAKGSQTNVTIKDFEKYVDTDCNPVLDRDGNILFETKVLRDLPEEPRKLLRAYFYDAIKFAKRLPTVR